MADWGQGAQGAAGGAMTGAAIGSVIPGVGTAVGAIGGGLLGGIAGLFGGDGAAGYQDQLKQLAQQYGSRQAPQGTAQSAQGSQFRSNQAGLIAQLESAAKGEGPSAAELQMRGGMDRAAGAQASEAAGAGGRGVNAGAAMRMAANNTAQLQATTNQQTGVLRAGEQATARGQLGQAIDQGVTADNQLSEFNTGQGNQMTQANMQSTLQQLGLNDKSQLQALMAAMGSAGPGTGAALLAGGASAMPMLMKAGGMGGAPGVPTSQGYMGAPAGGWPWQQGPVTSPDQV